MFLSILQVVLVPIALGLLAQRLLGERTRQVAEVLPLVSVFSIVVIIAAVVAASQARIAESGLLIMAVVMLHNGFGLSLGYLTGKLTGMPLAQRKALAIEVGMQNSGPGAALANAHFAPGSGAQRAVQRLAQSLRFAAGRPVPAHGRYAALSWIPVGKPCPDR